MEEAVDASTWSARSSELAEVATSTCATSSEHAEAVASA
jgi:hypothetical protein